MCMQTVCKLYEMCMQTVCKLYEMCIQAVWNVLFKYTWACASRAIKEEWMEESARLVASERSFAASTASFETIMKRWLSITQQNILSLSLSLSYFLFLSCFLFFLNEKSSLYHSLFHDSDSLILLYMT